MSVEEILEIAGELEMTVEYDEENDVLHFEHVDEEDSIQVVELMAIAQEIGYVFIGYLFADEYNRDEGGSCFSMEKPQ